MISRRQQIGRALHALERAADAFGQCPGEHRLGYAGHIFEQHMPFAEVADQGQHDLLPFADDDFLDVGDDLFGERRDLRGADRGHAQRARAVFRKKGVPYINGEVEAKSKGWPDREPVHQGRKGPRANPQHVSARPQQRA